MPDTKGERTRERIVASAAPVFNRLGYAGASMTDLMNAAGLEKGGIYRHFPSKEAIAVAAFDHAAQLHGDRIRAYVAAAPASAVARMVAVAEAMATIVIDPVVAGGCPLLNTAVESDDAEGPLYPELRKRTRRAMDRLLGLIQRIVADGIAAGELSRATDAAAEASGLVATMEGALLLSKLYGDPVHVQRAVERVRDRASVLARPG
jgi:AcrR family transcriptional regulator